MSRSTNVARAVAVFAAAFALVGMLGIALWFVARVPRLSKHARRAWLVAPLAILAARGSDDLAAVPDRAWRAALGAFTAGAVLLADRRGKRATLAVACSAAQVAGFAALAHSEARLRFGGDPWRAAGTGSANRSAATTTQPRAHIVLIVLDSVRRDALSPYRSDATGPLTRLARESAVFVRATATGNYTPSSHAALFTGRLPHEALEGDRLLATVPTIAEKLREHGYRTAAFVANFGYLRAGTGFERGFDHYDAAPDCAFPALFDAIALRSPVPVRGYHRVGAHRPAAGVLADAAAFLQRAPMDPAFVFANLLEAHEYRAPRDALEKARGVYQDAVVDAELALASFVEKLRRSGILDRSLLIVTSDHGESFGEAGHAFHGSGWNEALLAIPLLVRSPGTSGHSQVSLRTGLVDLPDLINQAAAGSADLQAWLQSRPEGPRVLATVFGDATLDCARPVIPVVYAADIKYVRHAGGEWLVNLAQDPTETHPLVAGEVPAADPLRQAAAAVSPCLVDKPPRADERLRALGYAN